MTGVKYVASEASKWKFFFAKFASLIIPFLFLTSGCARPPLELPRGPEWVNLPNPDDVEPLDFYYPSSEIFEALEQMDEAVIHKQEPLKNLPGVRVVSSGQKVRAAG